MAGMPQVSSCLIFPLSSAATGAAAAGAAIPADSVPHVIDVALLMA